MKIRDPESQLKTRCAELERKLKEAQRVLKENVDYWEESGCPDCCAYERCEHGPGCIYDITVACLNKMDEQ